MSKQDVAPPTTSIAEKTPAQRPGTNKPEPVLPFGLVALGLIVCILISASPLLHMAGKSLFQSLPTNDLLLVWGAWLPVDLHLAQNAWGSMYTTGAIEFLSLMALAFGIYALSAWFIHRQPTDGDYRPIMRIIWAATIVMGLIYVLIPAMLSRDIFVYVGYGRTITAHQANPYFVTLSAFSQDPLNSYDDWKNATSAYGPLWLLVCSFWTLLIGTSPLAYVLAFRLFALAAHLANTWLIATILKKMGYSPRTVALGTLLYAWNPLALMESSMGGHNDVLMITFILLGILLCLRAEHNGFKRLLDYLPPVIAFTLAVLIKFTAAPLIAFVLVLLARHTLYAEASHKLVDAPKRWANWRPAFLKLLIAGIGSGIITLGFYAPFWIGHSLHDIVASFSSPPSSYFSENSVLRFIYEWIEVHGLPPHNSWAYLPVYLLSQHSTWNVINVIALACTMVIGAIWLWRVPTTRTLILASLLTLGVLLIVTPWFFPWYVTWLVALAVIYIPALADRRGQAWVAFAFTFSVTSLIVYLFHDVPPLGHWNVVAWSCMIGIPVLVLLLFVFRKYEHSRRSLAEKITT
jgi:hypothetical protein